MVPQLLDKIKEAQGVLDLAHSADGDDKSNSPDPNPGAESADGFQARLPTCVRELRKFVYPLDRETSEAPALLLGPNRL